jgi:integrase
VAEYSRKTKPEKPYPEFPLFAHATGRWAKKIKGKFHYFGPWEDSMGALAKFERTIHDIRLGREPADDARLSIKDLVNHFLGAKRDLVDSGELAERTWAEYRTTGATLLDEMGRETDVSRLRPDDFAALRASLAKTRGLKTLDGEIGRIRAIFNYAFKADLLDSPVRYGMAFNKPSRKSLKKESQKRPAKIFTVEELIAIYSEANATMRAFILLGLNGGLGGTDIGLLEPRHIVDGWIRYPRPKTAVDREFPLWPETLTAMQAVRRPASELPYYFLTKRGLCWAKTDGDSPISKEFRKICLAAKCHQLGRGFYSLRHQFRTIADGSRDAPAINRIMGHTDASMGAHYTEWIAPERLQAVADTVRDWCKPMFTSQIP